MWLTIGKIVSPQGLGGKIRVNPSSDFSERFTKPGFRWVQRNEEEPRKFKLISGRQIPGKSIFVISLEGISDRQKAKSLVGLKLLVIASDRPKLKANEFHFLDLVGLDVRLKKTNASIGKVIDLTNAGNDLLEIQLSKGKKVLIPFVKEIVTEVNLLEGWLEIKPPPGLLEL